MIDWTYTGNRLRPAQELVGILRLLIEWFSAPVLWPRSVTG